DRLSRSGTRFENFFCVSPVCSPARASLLTGRIPSQHGVHDWITAGNLDQSAVSDNLKNDPEYRAETKPIEYLAGYTAYTDLLAQQGYACGLTGKWHLGHSMLPQKSFSYWYAHTKGGGPYFNAAMIENGMIVREPGYITDVITDHAVSYIREKYAKPAPFYLGVNFTAPHSPWDRENHPAELFDEYFKNCAFTSCPDLPFHPWQTKGLAATGDQRRRQLAGYFAAITALDMNVGRILDTVESLGIRDRTLIFFTSDNGMNMGHHGIWGKGNGTFPQNMYDTSVKVPAIISLPGHVPAGAVNTDLLSHYDFFPTLCDYLGMPNPEADSLPGKSFAPLLRGEPLSGCDSIVVFDEYGPVRMIRNREWKYIHRYPHGPHELYHLSVDPDEEKNLIDEPHFQNISSRLRHDLGSWFLRYADPRIDGSRESVYGSGQISLAGLKGGGESAYNGPRQLLRKE
ncbi:MAG: sulfatase-like hydrolase/transferase, partial [Thermodesulfobacteriota bacterium]